MLDYLKTHVVYKFVYKYLDFANVNVNRCLKKLNSAMFTISDILIFLTNLEML